MTAPNVSVILPTKNRTDLLPMSAGSVLSQAYRDLELIVVDDGSDEDVGSAVAALNDPRARCVRRESNGGAAAARNTGVQHAVGRYLAFQDSDDEWLPGKLEQQVSAVEQNAGSMSVCGLLRKLRSHVRPYLPPINASGAPLTLGQIAFRPLAYTQTWLVPRAAVISVGGFDERLKVWDDWELLLRLANKVAIYPLRETLVVSSQLPDSISCEGDRFLHDVKIILAKHEHDLVADPNSLARLQRDLGRLSISNGDLPTARRALMRSLRVRPSELKSWALLAVALLTPFAAKRVVNAYRDILVARGAFS